MAPTTGKAELIGDGWLIPDMPGTSASSTLLMEALRDVGGAIVFGVPGVPEPAERRSARRSVVETFGATLPMYHDYQKKSK